MKTVFVSTLSDAFFEALSSCCDGRDDVSFVRFEQGRYDQELFQNISLWVFAEGVHHEDFQYFSQIYLNVVQQEDGCPVPSFSLLNYQEIFILEASGDRLFLPNSRVRYFDRPVHFSAFLEDLLSIVKDMPLMRDGVIFDPVRKTLSYQGDDLLMLTEKEAGLLQMIFSTGSEGIDREVLRASVWPDLNGAETRVLETHLSNLRAKLKSCGKVLIDIVPCGAGQGVGLNIQTVRQVREEV